MLPISQPKAAAITPDVCGGSYYVQIPHALLSFLLSSSLKLENHTSRTESDIEEAYGCPAKRNWQ
jgi:hypothetical protein